MSPVEKLVWSLTGGVSPEPVKAVYASSCGLCGEDVGSEWAGLDCKA